MKANVGGVDRVVRLAVGIAVIAVGIAYGSWWGLLGIIPLATALAGWCPLYQWLKLSGTKARPAEQAEDETPPAEPER